jgi:hypothetical protein
MPILRLEIDQKTYESLIAVAIREWRPTKWEAEMLLRRAIHHEQARQVCPCPTCERPYCEPEETAEALSVS